jgi:hypothetical protein
MDREANIGESVTRMVDLVQVICGNYGFEQMLVIGRSNPDQVYNDPNDDFNYYKVFYCPKHHAFINFETFNQNSSQLQAHICRNDQCQTETGCSGIIAAVDMTTILNHTISDALGVEQFPV